MDDASMTLSSKSRLGPYEVHSLLGAGGMGEVYRAHDPRLDRDVAIKVLPPDLARDETRRRRFIQEARAASALNHPNIVAIHELESADGVDFIVMEYVPGKTIDAVIRSGLRVNDALRIAIPVADALAAAHAAGIVHRDLKPANVMVTPDGAVKVLDFGLAKLVAPEAPSEVDATTVTGAPKPDTLSHPGTVAGTPAYMSPEQATGGKVDARSDVFSFGALLYEMVTGRRAFQAPSREETLRAVVAQPVKPPSEIPTTLPPELERLILRCLKKEPERRFQHMGDVRVELQEIKEESDSGIAAARVVALRPWRWRWLAVGLALVSLIAVVVAFRYSSWGRESSAPPQSGPTLTQLTSYAGAETLPSFSPDGAHVAFVWAGEDRRNVDIYVKAVDGTTGPPMRLTTNPAVDTVPAWSPDGRAIAFKRTVRPTDAPPYVDVMLVPALGGPERKIASLTASGTALSWTPDGRWLATADRDPTAGRGIFLVPVSQGERRRLTSNPLHGDHWPAVSPDGRWLAYYSGSGVYSGDLHVLRLGEDYRPEAKPRRLTHQGLTCSGISWTPDGREIVYSGAPSYITPYLWRVGLSEGSTPLRIDLARRGALYPAVSRAGRRLVYSESTSDRDIWRIVGTGPPQPLLHSTKIDRAPDLSPDGTRLAFCSNRATESLEIFVSDADGSNALQITDRIGREQCSPRWSPDGKRIVFDSQTERGDFDLFVIDATGGTPRLLASTPFIDSIGSWSRDGRFVYFNSDRTGRPEIWRVPASGGEAEQVTDAGGLTGPESLDGRTLYYVKTRDTSPQPLFARTLGTPGERRIAEGLTSRSIVADKTGVLYFTRGEAPGTSSLKHLDVATGTIREVAHLDLLADLGLTTAPDGQTILFGAIKPANSDLFVIENFR